MRLALPNASFIGFTGTPLFKHDELTKRIFGDYVSRYDFKRSEEDGATVKLVYENRGEKLGIATARPERPHRREDRGGRARPRSGRRCSRSCSARTTRSSPPTTGWTRSRPISSSTARRAGSRASRCSSASTRSGGRKRPEPSGKEIHWRVSGRWLVSTDLASPSKKIPFVLDLRHGFWWAPHSWPAIC